MFVPAGRVGSTSSSCRIFRQLYVTWLVCRRLWNLSRISAFDNFIYREYYSGRGIRFHSIVCGSSHHPDSELLCDSGLSYLAGRCFPPVAKSFRQCGMDSIRHSGQYLLACKQYGIGHTVFWIIHRNKSRRLSACLDFGSCKYRVTQWVIRSNPCLIPCSRSCGRLVDVVRIDHDRRFSQTQDHTKRICFA